MDHVKIYRRGKVEGLYELTVNSFIETTDELIFELEGNECYSIESGDLLYFVRFIKGEWDELMNFSDSVEVKFEDENHLIHTTLLPKETIKLENENWHELYYDETTSFDLINCFEDHNLFPQDLDVSVNQELYFYDYNGNLLSTCSGIASLQMEKKKPMTVLDCIVREEKEKTCGKQYDYVKKLYYNFLPACEGRKTFILTDFEEALAKDARYIEKKFNKYYFYTIQVDNNGDPTELDDYGNAIRHCVLYGDTWFDRLVDSQYAKYINEGPSHCGFFEDRNYFNVNIGLSSDSNETRLGDDELFSETYATSIEESLIPDYIDMERVKYIPCVVNGQNVIDVSKIIIYPHFRERVVVDENNNTNTLSTSGNLYYDGWYIDTEDEADKYWNGYDWSNGFSSMNNFLSQCGKTADLIGYLNFTDNDIYYKKNKVTKSFYRLSFYNSNNPIENKLLFYSTVFVDGTELLSKYLKQSQYIADNEHVTDVHDENYIFINDIAEDNDNVKTVFCENTQIDSRLDTTITITNEFDNTRSAEGFNVYLFSDDIPLGNSSKTIYMRIDFNHAGNGKTIPLIAWPKNIAGQCLELTTENFVKSLYIPIEIFEKDGKFYYTIKDASYDNNGTIELILLEPKLNNL